MLVDYLLTVGQLILGLVLLSVGGERLVYGASRLAIIFGIPPLVVGLTLVALGTSAPELAVVLQSVFRRTPDVGVGNIVGSGIFNILVILGIAAWLQPLTVASRVVRYEVPLMIATTAGFWALCANGVVTPSEGLVLVAVLMIYLFWLVVQTRRDRPEYIRSVEQELVPREGRLRIGPVLAITFCLIGGVLLWWGSEWAVTAAVDLATLAGVPPVVVALTILAAGTSLPELATSVAAAIRRESDICVGNVVGSNILNIGAAFAPSAAIAAGGVPVANQILAVDFPVLFGISLLCLPVFWSGGRVDRAEGALFLLLYGGYLSVLAGQAVRFPGHDFWTDVYLWGVLPVALLVAITWAAVRRSGARPQPQSPGKPS